MAEAETTEMETQPPDIEMWEWESGESVHVDIPHNEQIPEPVMDDSRRRRIRPRGATLSTVPNLSGKSLEAGQRRRIANLRARELKVACVTSLDVTGQSPRSCSDCHSDSATSFQTTAVEVQGEADRIKLGQYFSSFIEFDRCLHSWCVLNGRAAARLKTWENMCVRTCRFGQVRMRWRPPQSPLHTDKQPNVGTSHVPPDFNETQTIENQANAGTIQVPLDLNETQIVQNQPTVSINEVPPDLNETMNVEEEPDLGWHLEDGDWTLTDCDPEVDSGPATAIKSRAPLGSIQPNTLGRESVGVDANQKEKSVHGQALKKAARSKPRSIVQHTSVWLPGSQSKRGSTQVSGLTQSEKGGTQVGGVIRQQSHTGACGQLARFQAPPPPPPPDEDHNNSPPSTPCPFRIRCQRHKKTGRCHITVCELNHTCPQVGHKWRGPTQKSHWLGETLAPRVTRNVKVPVKELLDGFQQDYYKSTNYHQMWRSKDLVRDWYLGGQRISFHQIPDLLRHLSEVDAGCIVDWSTEQNSDTFRRAFICPSATRRALQYCQPVVSFDACHTKNRKFPTQLFLATVLDGNSQVLILCYGVAPVENTDNWMWFLDQVDRAIEGIGEPHIAFMSDRQKGLIAAVKEIFPGKVHGACANHLRANVKTNYGKAAAQFFGGCIYANTKKKYDDILARLVSSMARGVAAKEYIENIDPEVYARYAFPLPRMGKVTSNPAEQANSGLLPIREFAPFKLLLELWYYMQGRFNDRRAKANRSVALFTNQATNRHNVNLKTFGQWKVFDDGQDSAKIETAGHTEQYLVKLSSRPTCTCFELQEMCWPCQHIMAWDDRDGRDYTLRFHSCWKISSLKMLYQPIMPSFLSNDFQNCRWCCPPEVAVQKGRHRVVRLRSGGGQCSRSNPLGPGESIDSMGDLFRLYPIHDDPLRIDPMPSANAVAREITQGRPTSRRQARGVNVGKNKCSSCGRSGHNKRSCAKVTVALLAAEAQGQPSSETIPTTMEQTFPEVVTDSQMMEPETAIAMPACTNGVAHEAASVPDYSSSSSEEDPPTTAPVREVSPGRFGSTQNPEDPDWMAHGLDNWAGVSQVQEWIHTYAP